MIPLNAFFLGNTPMPDPTPQPAPQPTPQPDYSGWLIILVVAYILLTRGGGGGSTSPTKIIPPAPAALTVFDDTPDALIALTKDHPGVVDVIDSTVDGSILKWYKKDKSGQWLKYGTQEPPPDPKLADNAWAVEAYQVWIDAGKKVPWTVASGPTGKGYSGPTPDGQEAAAKLLKVTGK